jgi:site-specific recombinase XerD
MEKYHEQMQMDMELRGFAASTKKIYNLQIARFFEYWGKEPEAATEKDLCKFLVHLLREGNLSPSSVNAHNTVLRFFYEVTLNRPLNHRALPRFRTGFSMPELLTLEEIEELLKSCRNLKHKCMLMTLYGSGIRLSELINLKIADVDSTNMRLFIRKGKQKRDRYALLSKVNLEILREYWKEYRPAEWLFEGKDKGSPYSTRGVQKIFERCLDRAGITKGVRVHTLRHCFAVHMLEQGADIYEIKQLLGHTNIKSTVIYLQAAPFDILNITSPLDKLMGGQADD